MKRFLLLIFLSFYTFAEGDGKIEPDGIVGMSLSESFAAFGVPNEVFPLRGSQENYDDVVFFYKSNFMYLSWYRSKVFQVSFDSRCTDEILGFKMKMSKKSALEKISKVVFEDENTLVFDLTFAAYLKRVKLVFKNGLLDTIYIYRADY